MVVTVPKAHLRVGRSLGLPLLVLCHAYLEHDRKVVEERDEAIRALSFLSWNWLNFEMTWSINGVFDDADVILTPLCESPRRVLELTRLGGHHTITPARKPAFFL